MQITPGHGSITTVARAVLGLLATLLVVSGLTACGRVDPKPDPPPAPVVRAPDPPPDPPSPYVVINVKERRLDLVMDDTSAPLASFPIAVGRKGHETPIGRFKVEEKIENPEFQKVDPNEISHVLAVIPAGPANPLGQRWIGFIKGDGWTVGIHGTPHPELLGKAVSGGCIRMRNADVLRVYETVEVGTPVIVRP